MCLSITLHCSTHHTRKDCKAQYTVPCQDSPGTHGMSDAATQLVLGSQRDGWDLRPVGTDTGVKTIALCPPCAEALVQQAVATWTLDEEEPSIGKPFASGPTSAGLPSPSSPASSASPSAPVTAPSTSCPPNTGQPTGCTEQGCPDLGGTWGNSTASHQHELGWWIPGLKRKDGYRMLVRFCTVGRECSYHEHWDSRGWEA